MKAGYTVDNHIGVKPNFIIVANYSSSLNLLSNYGFSSKNETLTQKDENDIGFWRIKRKEIIKAK